MSQSRKGLRSFVPSRRAFEVLFTRGSTSTSSGYYLCVVTEPSGPVLVRCCLSHAFSVQGSPKELTFCTSRRSVTLVSGASYMQVPRRHAAWACSAGCDVRRRQRMKGAVGIFLGKGAEDSHASLGYDTRACIPYTWLLCQSTAAVPQINGCCAERLPPRCRIVKCGRER